MGVVSARLGGLWMFAACGLATVLGCGGGGGDGGGGDDGGTRDVGPPPDAGVADADAPTDAGPEGDGGDCPHTGDPVFDPTLFDPCPMCSGGHCVPTSLVPEEQVDLLADCDEESKCVPDPLIETAGNYVPPNCRSVGDAEGRCLSECIPQVAEQVDLLPQASCADGERCVPCFDPTTGEDTGACTLACDAPEEDPSSFAECCDGVGSCVPRDLVPEDQRDVLGPDDCEGEDALCAPTDLTDPSVTPTVCASVGDVEGRCLPACLPDVQEQADLLPQDVCPDTHLCVPCYDPLTGEDTGACRLNGDEPGEDPTTFDECCGGIGSCVPESIVPEEQREQLGMDTCTEAGTLCAPDEFSDSSYTPPTCGSVGGFEGRCLPECLPDVQEQADTLPRSSCMEGYLCTPCYDPITGEDTGACRLNGDEPADPPSTFEDCCGGLGSCVLPELVPEDQRDQLGNDTCSDADALCAPDDFVDPSFTPPVCDSVAGAEGRCLPECLPDVQEQADFLPQDVCAENHLCVPCTDPITGESTGACTINGDAPTEDPVIFDKCCPRDSDGSTRGTCVPESLVPEEDRDSLPQDSCASGDLCVPDVLLADPTHSFPMCNTALSGEGACLPECMVTGFESIFIGDGDCSNPTDDDCVPCTVFGSDTGACR